MGKSTRAPLESAEQIRASIPIKYKYVTYTIRSLKKLAVCKVELLFGVPGHHSENDCRKTRSFRFDDYSEAQAWALQIHQQLGGKLVDGKKPHGKLRKHIISVDRNIEIEKLYYQGFTTAIIAEKLKITTTAVNDHIREIKKRFLNKEKPPETAAPELDFQTQIERLSKRIESLENTVMTLTKTIQQTTQGK